MQCVGKFSLLLTLSLSSMRLFTMLMGRRHLDSTSCSSIRYQERLVRRCRHVWSDDYDPAHYGCRYWW